MNYFAVSYNTFLYFLCAVRSLAGHVDDLECFYHLFLPGGWRSVQGKKTFFLLIPHLCSKCVCTSSVAFYLEKRTYFSSVSH